MKITMQAAGTVMGGSNHLLISVFLRMFMSLGCGI